MSAETAKLLEDLAAAYRERDATLQDRFARSLPMQDAFTDRWERAERLGFGKGASIYNSAVVYGDVTVGEGTWIGPYVVLDGSGGPLAIGSFCSISAGVHLYTHDTVEWALTGGRAAFRKGAVSVGDCCYLGSQAVVAAGVMIASHCVVSANSLVKDDVPTLTVVGGTPARRIGGVVLDGDRATLRFDHHG